MDGQKAMSGRKIHMTRKIAAVVFLAETKTFVFFCQGENNYHNRGYHATAMREQ